MIRPADSGGCIRGPVFALPVAEQTEPGIGVPYDPACEFRFPDEQMACGALHGPVAPGGIVADEAGMAIIAFEDGRVICRFLLPFVEAFVGRVDVQDGRIEVQARFEIP